MSIYITKNAKDKECRSCKPEAGEQKFLILHPLYFFSCTENGNEIPDDYKDKT